MTDLRIALTYNRDDRVVLDSVEHTLTYTDHAGAHRRIMHLRYSDALQRAHVLRARGYRNVNVQRTIY